MSDIKNLKCYCYKCYDSCDGCTAWSCKDDFEIGIDKIGFRMRLLNKLRTEAQNYANKANRTSVVFETRKNENEEFCNLCKTAFS